jgi:hypothetical protein
LSTFSARLETDSIGIGEPGSVKALEAGTILIGQAGLTDPLDQVVLVERLPG